MTKKRNFIIFICILLIALLMGISYAFFSTRIIGTSKKVKATVDKLSITFDGGNSVALNSNFYSSDDIFITKNIIIKNIGNQNLNYDLYWENITNTFINKDDLVYSITCSTSVNNGTNCKNLSEREIPMSGNNIPIISNININSNETQTFVVTYKLLNTDFEQSINSNSIFEGKIYITTDDYVTNYVYSEPKDLQNTPGLNYLANKLLTDNTLITIPATLSKMPVTQSTYDNLQNNDVELSIGRRAGKNKSVVENGLFKTIGDDGFYTYYFRGVVNNHIKLGDLNGRIIRINENGTIRVIINVDDDSESYHSLDSPWNSSLNTAYSGSTAKNTIDSFYYKKLSFLLPLMDYGVFCGDTSIVQPATETAEDIENSLVNLLGVTISELEESLDEMEVTYNPSSYYPDRRDYVIQILYIAMELDPNSVTEEEMLEEVFPSMNGFEDRENNSEYSFKCSKSSDKYIYKVGLPSVDEICFSGMTTSLLSEDYDMIEWADRVYTMTPASDSTMYAYVAPIIKIDVLTNNFSYGGQLLDIGMYYSPVINLRNDVKITGGNGSSANPYILDLNS